MGNCLSDPGQQYQSPQQGGQAVIPQAPAGVCDVIFFPEPEGKMPCHNASKPDTVLALHQRGVRVRIITDDDQAESQGSDISKFRQAGIPVKVDHLKTHMHHKFCIIDNRLLLNGSFNWTRQAVLGNQENVVVIEQPFLIQQFYAQFEKLWAMFRA